MELLYLDSYYFYAPIPRVCKLKEVLSRKLPHCRFNKKFKLLYLCSEHLGFSSPISFLKLLTQTIYDETITNITTLFAEGHEAGRTFQEFLNLMKSIIFRSFLQRRPRFTKTCRQSGSREIRDAGVPRVCN